MPLEKSSQLTIVENDFSFCGATPRLKFVKPKVNYRKYRAEERAKFKESLGSFDPWNRLDNTWTTSSAEHTVFYTQRRPFDYLDFALASIYCQSQDLFCARRQISLQPRTIGIPSEGMICWKELPKPPPVPPLPFNHPLVYAPEHYRMHPDSLKLAIESHHSSLTNRGYSRKPDGGYYTT